MKIKHTLCLIAAAALVSTLNASADGAAVYASKCASCHGADGKGATMMGKKLKVKDMTVTKPTEAQVVKSIKEGVKEGDKVVMKPVASVSDDDAKALAAFIKGLK